MAIDARGDRGSERNSPEARPTYADIEYRTVGDRTLALDIYLPPRAAERPPVVLCIHGGAWRGGSKEGMRGACGAFADAGFAVVAIQYRLSQEAIFPAQIHDCKAAVRWIRAHAAEYGWDAERIAAFGTSAGGHLAALLGASGGVVEKTVGNVTLNIAGAESDGAGLGSRVQAVVDFYGPTDFSKMDSYPSRIKHDAADSPESELIGAPIQEAPDRVALANPITYLDSGDPPFYIAHGKADMAVPFNQSERLRDRLAEIGAPYF